MEASDRVSRVPDPQAQQGDGLGMPARGVGREARLPRQQNSIGRDRYNHRVRAQRETWCACPPSIVCCPSN